ncbi:HNH endonuclease [Enterovibrio norvegicus]|uniref:HNH endonuclease n=1 Tax=Enterovibrio norvegicus DSM 15893 TaxID=1121869 RepID=A0A1I5TFR1_9GAMM|nr:HNH endonuclease [Enterovibrio norvegicus]SFP81236.1 HNH endonuclease [Enterovibrio norvegicus DSM 15893]
MELLSAYLKKAIPGVNDAWNKGMVADLALTITPELIFFDKQSLLKGDMTFVWLSWFIESIYDYNLAPDNIVYADVFSLVRRGLLKSGLSEDSEHFVVIWKNVSKVIYTFICRMQGRKRQSVTKTLKEDLVSLAQNDLKCWICGYRFSHDSIQLFLNQPGSIQLPSLVDYLSPRGLVERDLKIEVEHKQPFSSGGGDLDDLDNIDLSCGYCNRHKWKFLSIYDANRSLRSFSHSRLGLVSVPQPYWVIRLLALADRCTEAGCTVTKNKQQLYVDFINDIGSAAPTNLKVVCRKHLRNSGDRFVSAVNFKDRTKKGRRSLL